MKLPRFRFVLPVMLLACGALAQQPARLDSVVDIGDDGSAVSAERLQLPGPMTEPLRWRMRTASVNPIGVRQLLFIDVLELTDGRGNRIQSSTRKFGDRIDVLIPRQPLAGNTVRITYEIRNAVTFRPDRDELFWRVGNGWAVPIRALSLNVTIPDAATGQVTGQFLAGGTHGGLQRARFQGTTADIEAAHVEQPVLDLVFAPGVLHPPATIRRIAWFLQGNPIVFLPGLLLVAMIGYRWYTRRGTAPQMSVAPRYEPPEDLPPAEAGYLIDDRLDPRDLAAMLLDLARRGFISIEAGEPDEGVPYAAPDFVLRLLKPMDHWAGAYSYEHIMLFHTFYGGQWTKLSSVSLRFYSVIPSIRQMIRDELQQKQLYMDPRRIPAQRIGAVLILAALLWMAQAAGWFAVAQSALLVVVSVVTFVLAALLVSPRENHRTAKGERVFTELRGFEMFLNSVEADRMQRVTPELFETCLPYAVALGMEHRWCSAFSTISSGPPLWWEQGKGGIPDFVHLVGSYARPGQGMRGQAAKAATSTGSTR